MTTNRLRRTTKGPISKTHPWIDFTLDLRGAPIELWMMIGEAASKCEHIDGVPLQPEAAERLYGVYLAKGVHATTSIEGNTLTEEQVRQKMKGELRLPKSQEYLGVEVDNVLAACDEIARKLLDPGESLELTPELICHFNGLVLRGLETAEGVEPGKIRTYDVGVMNYRGAPHAECEELVRRLCEWLGEIEPPAAQFKFAYALIRAVVAHLYIAWIHPFGDGNGRTARLIEFLLLARSGVPLPATQLLSNHYNRTRTRYYAELDRSSKRPDGVVSFLRYAAEGFVDGLREQLAYIREQQWEVAWEKFVYDSFRNKNTAACHRQRLLLLDLKDEPVTKRELTQISARVATQYAKKGDKTLTRDINQLRKMRLIKKRGGGYVRNRDLILATWRAPKHEPEGGE